MGTKATERGVNRLLDIVVEEVSLVDRAANKHRFLIVKRSDDMDETTTDTAATIADDTEDVQDLAADTGEDSGGNDGGEGGSAGTDTPLGSALAALEGLTEAVEILATAGGDAVNPRLAELAGELSTVSQRLAGLAGGAPATAASGGEGQEGQAEATDGDPLAAAIESVRATLTRVSSVIEAAGKGPDGGAGAGGVAGDAVSAGSNPDAGTAGDGVAAQLGTLVTELRTLTGTVQEQQQRLARLEKRFGLPNSAPSGERPAKPEDEDVGWPLDLNRPYDRESVDKAVSFHDV